MVWAYFQNQAAFNAYHNTVCTDQGIPKAGRNMATNEPAIMACWTDAFVEPIQIRSKGNVTTWTAHIPDAHATQYGDVHHDISSDPSQAACVHQRQRTDDDRTREA